MIMLRNICRRNKMQNQNLIDISGIFLENLSIRKTLFSVSTNLTIDISLSGKSCDDKTWWLTRMFILTTAVKLAVFSKKNITINAYFFKTGKFQNSFRRHLEAQTNRIYDGASDTNQSTDRAVRQECILEEKWFKGSSIFSTDNHLV